MLQGEFNPHRRSLRLRRGGKFSCPWVGAHCNNQLTFGVWTTTRAEHSPKMAFKFIMRDSHHLVNELWLPLEEHIGTQILEIQIFTCMFSNFVHMCTF